MTSLYTHPIILRYEELRRHYGIEFAQGVESAALSFVAEGFTAHEVEFALRTDLTVKDFFDSRAGAWAMKHVLPSRANLLAAKKLKCTVWHLQAEIVNPRLMAASIVLWGCPANRAELVRVLSECANDKNNTYSKRAVDSILTRFASAASHSDFSDRVDAWLMPPPWCTLI